MALRRFLFELIEVDGVAAGAGCFALGAGFFEAQHNAFADEFAFELGQGSEDAEHEAAVGGVGVDALAQGDEGDSPGVKTVERVDELAQGSGEAGKIPDDDRGDSSLAGVGHDGFEGGALGFFQGTTQPLIEIFFGGPTAGVAIAAEFEELSLDVLAVGADAGVNADGAGGSG